MLLELLVAVIVFGLIYYIVTLIPLPPPFRTIALVVMALIGIVWLLSLVSPGLGGPLFLHR
jgi:hypothetical protein